MIEERHSGKRASAAALAEFWIAMICVLLVSPTQAAPLTVEEAVRLATERPVLAAAQASAVAVEAARGEQESVWPNPVVFYETERIYGGAHAGLEDAVGVSQRIDFSGRRGLRRGAASERSEAARLDGEAVKRRAGVEARRRFWEVVHQQVRYAIAARWVNHVERALTLMGERQEAGASSLYETLKLGQAMRGARAELGAAQVAREVAWLDLLTLTGTVEAPSGWPRAQGVLVPSAEEIGPGGAEQRADVRAWILREQAARREQEAADRGWIPQLNLSAGWRSVEVVGAERAHGFQAGVGLSIPIFDRGQADGELARARQMTAGAMRERLTEDVRRQERPALERAAGLAALAREMRVATDASARQIEATAEAAWRDGELGILELLDVRRGTRNDALATLELEHEARNAREALRALRLQEVP